MNKNIPTYQLNILSNNDGKPLDIFLLNQKVETPRVSIETPYRSDYYGIGICLRGRGELNANLESYTVKPNYLVTMSPHIIKQWVFMSQDFETLTIFFTKEFITTNNTINPDKFQFFESVAKHSYQISDAQAENIIRSLNFLQNKYGTPHEYRNEILRNLINILLYEIASIYDQQYNVVKSTQTRSQHLTSEFKKLVNQHFLNERSVKFYAEKLFISSKHLSDILKETTGKTAGEWIYEMVILEAKVLLQNPAMSISQISDILNFDSQSTFGKFLKTVRDCLPLLTNKRCNSIFRLFPQ